MGDFEDKVFKFTRFVFSKIGIDISAEEAYPDDYDLDRIYIDVCGKSYIIRMWNVNDEGIRYSLYEDKGYSGEEVYYGYYPF